MQAGRKFWSPVIFFFPPLLKIVFSRNDYNFVMWSKSQFEPITCLLFLNKSSAKKICLMITDRVRRENCIIKKTQHFIRIVWTYCKMYLWDFLSSFHFHHKQNIHISFKLLFKFSFWVWICIFKEFARYFWNF